MTELATPRARTSERREISGVVQAVGARRDDGTVGVFLRCPDDTAFHGRMRGDPRVGDRLHLRAVVTPTADDGLALFHDATTISVVPSR